MDEIEMKKAYNDCVNMIGSVPITEGGVGQNITRSMFLMLMMIWECHERILEMQVEEDDDEC